MEQTEPIKLKATLNSVKWNASDEGEVTIVLKVAKQNAPEAGALALHLPCVVDLDVWVRETL